jgi:hypothetical protein
VQFFSAQERAQKDSFAQVFAFPGSGLRLARLGFAREQEPMALAQVQVAAV